MSPEVVAWGIHEFNEAEYLPDKFLGRGIDVSGFAF